MPKISIITPVLNQVEKIERCILSVADQNVDVEHIIIDGGSTDGTVDIILKHADKLSYWKSEPDTGQSQAINKGLAKAAGTYFNWLNADDRLTNGALSEVLTYFDDDVDLVVGKCQHVDENGRWLAVGAAEIWDTVEGTLGSYSMGQPSHFYRTESVHQLGGLNESLHYCMDMELWFRYLLANGQGRIAQTEQVLSLFEVGTLSKSQRESVAMNEEKIRLFKTLLSQFALPPVLQDFYSKIEPFENVDLKAKTPIDHDALFSHFAWKPLLANYQMRNMEAAKDCFKLVKSSDRLSGLQKFLWTLRLSFAQ